jgi:hypothetical protein
MKTTNAANDGKRKQTNHKRNIDRLQVRLATLIDDLLDESRTAREQKLPSAALLDSVCDELDTVKYHLDDAFRALD